MGQTKRGGGGPQRHIGQLPHTPSATSSTVGLDRCGQQTNCVNGVSNWLTLFNKAVDQELQESGRVMRAVGHTFVHAARTRAAEFGPGTGSHASLRCYCACVYTEAARENDRKVGEMVREMEVLWMRSYAAGGPTPKACVCAGSTNRQTSCTEQNARTERRNLTQFYIPWRGL